MDNKPSVKSTSGKKKISKKELKKRKQRRLKLILGMEIGVFSVIILVGLCVWFIGSKLDKIGGSSVNKDDIEINDNLNEEINEYTNIALFGVDARDQSNEAGTHSDCIIVASINNKTKEVKMVSIYRDTLLEMVEPNPSPVTQKATQAYFWGGPEEAINTLNRNLDLNITEYATVNMNALSTAIDELGGVTINIDYEEQQWTNGYLIETREITGKDSEDVYETGDVLVNGLQATAYCRIRALSGGDFARTQRQREVISAMITKAKSSDLNTINNVINKVFPEVSTNFSKSDMISLAAGLFSYELGETTGFPFDVDYMDLDGTGRGSCVIPADLESNVSKLHKFLFDVDDYVPSETVKRISNDISAETGIYAPEPTTENSESY